MKNFILLPVDTARLVASTKFIGEPKEYILYLYKAKNFSNNSYAVVSYFKGVFEIDKDNNFKNVIDKYVIKYDDIKQKVEVQNNKN